MVTSTNDSDKSCIPQLTFYLFAFDEAFTTLQSVDTVDLTRWFAPGVVITQACFVSGSEEILVIDSVNTARIYSLIPQQFR